MGSLPPATGQYAQGFVGLNTFIYEPVGYDIENQYYLSYKNQELVNISGIGPAMSPVTQTHIGIHGSSSAAEYPPLVTTKM